MTLHDFTFRMSDGTDARIVVEDHGDNAFSVFAADRQSKYEIDIPIEDREKIDRLAEKAIGEAKHAADDRVYDEWKDSRILEAVK